MIKSKNVSRTIVTGGAGFIASHLVEKLLSEGLKVTVLESKPPIVKLQVSIKELGFKTITSHKNGGSFVVRFKDGKRELFLAITPKS